MRSGATCAVLLVAVMLWHKAGGQKLLYAHVVYRHGARAPGSTYPTDRHQMDYWTMGRKQLTLNGMRQQHRLGRFLRNRYSGFLSPEYVKEEIYVRSSAKDRALQSAEANVAGLYGPTPSFRRFEDSVNWAPVPVHSRKASTDLLLRTSSVDCGVFDRNKERVEHSIRAALDRQNEDFYANLTRLTGAKEPLNTERVLDDVWGAWSCELAEGLPLPVWAAQRWGPHPLTTFQRVREIKRQIRLAPFLDPVMASLAGGFLLNDVLERTRRAAEGHLDEDDDAAKLTMYSGHQSTVLSLLHTLGAGTGDLVPFAGCVGVELWEVEAQPSLLVWYRNATDAPDDRSFATLTLPGCAGEFCRLDRVLELYKSRTFATKKQRQAACGDESSSSPVLSQSYLLPIAFLSLSFLLADGL